MLETTLAQRTETLSQLEEVLNKIEQAVDQAAIVKAMKGSTEVLRNIRAEYGGIDKVEDVIEDLRQEMDQVDEVSTTIGAGQQDAAVADADAIDEELEAMMRQAEEKERDEEARRTAERLAGIASNIAPSTDLARSIEESERKAPKEQGTVDKPVVQSTQAMDQLTLGQNANSEHGPQKRQTVEQAEG